MVNRDGLKQVQGFQAATFGGGTAEAQNPFGLANPGAFMDQYQKRGQQFGDPAIAAQQKNLALLQRQAQGLGPSIAESQLRAQSARNVSDAYALAAMGRGGNQAGMQQSAMGTAAATQADTNNQAAIARLGEQQQAQAALMQQSQMMAQNQLGYEQLGMQGLLGGRQQDIDLSLGQQAQDLAEQKYHTDRNMGWAKVGIGAAGGLMKGIFGLSDERSKENIRPMSASQVVGEADPIAFEYKPGYGPSGQHIGVGAGQLEQTDLGPSLVRTGDDGLKRVDIGGASMAALAGVSDLSRRLDALEAGSRGGPRNDAATAANLQHRQLEGGQPMAGGYWDNRMGGRGGYALSDERTKDGIQGMSRVDSPRMRRLDALEAMLRGADNRSRGPFQGQDHFGSGDPMARGPMEQRIDSGRAEMRRREMDGGWDLKRPPSQPAVSDPFGPSSAALDAYAGAPPPARAIDPFADSQGVRINNPGELSQMPMHDASSGYALSDERAKQDMYQMGVEHGLGQAVGYGGVNSSDAVRGGRTTEMVHGFGPDARRTQSLSYQVQPGPTEPGEVMDPRWRRALAQQDDYIRRNTDIRTGDFRPSASDRGGSRRHFQDMRQERTPTRAELADLRSKRERVDIDRGVADLYDAEAAYNRGEDARMLGLTPERMARQDQDALAQYERRLALEAKIRAEMDAEYAARGGRI